MSSGQLPSSNLAHSAGNTISSFVPQSAAVVAVNGYGTASSQLNGLVDRYDATDSGEFISVCWVQ